MACDCIACATCDGRGYINMASLTWDDEDGLETCEDCGGEGYTETCIECYERWRENEEI